MWIPGHIKFAKHLLHSTLLLLKFIALSKSKCYSHVPILKKNQVNNIHRVKKSCVAPGEDEEMKVKLLQSDCVVKPTLPNVGWESQSKDTNLHIRNRSSRQCEMKIDFRLCLNIASLFCGSERKRSYFSKSCFMALHRVGATWDLVAVVNNSHSPVFVALSLAFPIEHWSCSNLITFSFGDFPDALFFFLATDDRSSEVDLYGTAMLYCTRTYYHPTYGVILLFAWYIRLTTSCVPKRYPITGYAQREGSYMEQWRSLLQPEHATQAENK